MSITTSIELKNNIITYRLKGIFDGLNIDNEIINIFQEMLENVKKYNCKRVLMDTTKLEYDIITSEKHKIGEFVANICNKNMIELACLRNLDKIDDFTEIVATNRGAKFKFFKDEKKAISWLKNIE